MKARRLLFTIVVAAVMGWFSSIVPASTPTVGNADDGVVTTSVPIELTDVESEAALVAESTVVFEGSGGGPFICFGLDCNNLPEGTVCNPILNCRCFENPPGSHNFDCIRG